MDRKLILTIDGNETTQQKVKDASILHHNTIHLKGKEYNDDGGRKPYHRTVGRIQNRAQASYKKKPFRRQSYYTEEPDDEDWEVDCDEDPEPEEDDDDGDNADDDVACMDEQ